MNMNATQQKMIDPANGWLKAAIVNNIDGRTAEQKRSGILVEVTVILMKSLCLDAGKYRTGFLAQYRSVRMNHRIA